MALPRFSRRPARPGNRFLLVTILVVAAAVALVLTHRQAVYDWVRLYHYQPPTAIAQLAADDTMTATARHAYYVNHPVLEDKSNFAPHCPSGAEQTVVLGCYLSNQEGIYLLQVSDPELAGVEQVTAAHETLHALYDRLSDSERARVDTLLTNYYQHSLSDQTIKQQIAAYRKSEPTQVTNEMHSLFGTEVAHLPAALEQYYGQYFTDRSKVTGYYASYEAAFTSRQHEIQQDDAQLATWRNEINQDKADLRQRQAALDSQHAALERANSSGDAAIYNSLVGPYNKAVDAYNAEVDSVRNLINQYNQLVSRRNAIALEEQQLVQAITSSPTTR